MLRHNNAPLNIKTREEFAPLHCACWHRQTEVAIALIDAGANIEVTVSNLSTPLHFSAWHGDTRLLQRLLAAGAQVGARTRDGDTALHQAVFGNRTQVGRADLCSCMIRIFPDGLFIGSHHATVLCV